MELTEQDKELMRFLLVDYTRKYHTDMYADIKRRLLDCEITGRQAEEEADRCDEYLQPHRYLIAKLKGN